MDSMNQSQYITGRSLCIFKANNVLREQIYRLVTSQYFDYFILLIIIISSIQLALDSPLENPESTKQQTLYIIDVATTAIFALEALLKIIAFGFLFNDRPSYLRSPWNLVDFIIICFSIISLTPLPSELKIFKMFRILRVLRLIGRNDSLKVGVKALVYALPNIANVTIIMLFFFLIFGIVAVSFFKGQFYQCNRDHLTSITFLDSGSYGLSDLILIEDQTVVSNRIL